MIDKEMEQFAYSLIHAMSKTINDHGFNPPVAIFACCELLATFINAMSDDDEKRTQTMELAIGMICSAMDDPMVKADFEETN